MLNLWTLGFCLDLLLASLMETAPPFVDPKLYNCLSSAYILSMMVSWKCSLLSIRLSVCFLFLVRATLNSVRGGICLSSIHGALSVPPLLHGHVVQGKRGSRNCYHSTSQLSCLSAGTIVKSLPPGRPSLIIRSGTSHEQGYWTLP